MAAISFHLQPVPSGIPPRHDLVLGGNLSGMPVAASSNRAGTEAIGAPNMTLDDIIKGRSMLPVENEVKAWADDRRRAEEVYLATIRLCDERMMAAWQRMSSEKKRG